VKAQQLQQEGKPTNSSLSGLLKNQGGCLNLD
jgi:hypothetical protein